MRGVTKSQNPLAMTGQAYLALLNTRLFGDDQTFRRIFFDGRLAQLVEQLTLNQRVVGSSPTAPTIEN